MNANGALQEELRRRGIASVDSLSAGEVVDLALRYAIWLPVSTYVRAPWLAPYAVRKVRHRIDDNAPGPKRDLWGMPDSRGYFADDNSLIKGVVLRSSVTPSSSPYGEQRITRGLVCCHVWSFTTGNPLLFSFVPNLVWLPSDLARYSDAHLAGPPHEVHAVLKAASARRYRNATPLIAHKRVEAAWSALVLHPTDHSPTFPPPNEFVVADRVVNLVSRRMTKLTQFLAATLEPGAHPPARFSKRYHAGHGPGIDGSVRLVQDIVDRSARRLLLEEMLACSPPDST